MYAYYEFDHIFLIYFDSFFLFMIAHVNLYVGTIYYTLSL